jgi:protein arginine kinase
MGHTPLEPRRFADRVGTWLQRQGPDGDVVVSCRVRLARNVAGYPFVLRLEPERAEELGARLRALLVSQRIDGETIWVSMRDATPVVRLLLRERHLVSRDLAPTDPRQAPRPGRGVAFGEAETVSVMVNEEDHLRLQGIAAGFAIDDAWERVRVLDRALEDLLEYACSDTLGYMTGCPTNVGTGLRASVMLHLPSLGFARAERACLSLYRNCHWSGLRR